MSVRQLTLNIDSNGEAETYHDSTRFGYFSLLIQHPEGKRQTSYRLTEMAKVLTLVDPKKDTWMSQAEFLLPNRRIVNLARIGLLFVDIDSYKMPWAQNRSN